MSDDTETKAGKAAPPAQPTDLFSAMLGEFFGTFVLVFFGVGSVQAAVATGAQAGLWQVAVVWAVGVSLGIYTSASLSGAHINPAITVMAAVYEKFPIKRVVPYWVAQVAGHRRRRPLRHVRRGHHRVRTGQGPVARRPGE